MTLSMTAEADNTLLDLHNSSDVMKAHSRSYLRVSSSTLQKAHK